MYPFWNHTFVYGNGPFWPPLNKQMPAQAVQMTVNSMATKTIVPLSSVSEQSVVLDEYGIHLAQFSIAINRIVREVSITDKYNP